MVLDTTCASLSFTSLGDEAEKALKRAGKSAGHLRFKEILYISVFVGLLCLTLQLPQRETHGLSHHLFKAFALSLQDRPQTLRLARLVSRCPLRLGAASETATALSRSPGG